ncbi:MAG: ABC-F family ATP-binding cassette domain-containing protein [Candidatus Absconditicoccaceae bacterium]
MFYDFFVSNMSSNQNPIILRFDNVSFAYSDGKHPILIESDFSIRQNTKITIMGQNGSGKTTIFKMITGELKPQSGKINIVSGNTIAISRQVVPRDQLHLTIKEFFETAFDEKDYQLDKKISEVLKVVNFNVPINKQIKDFSGGQQARLLLAYALIQHPDILLLDEPTNNLDANGINDLIAFLISYDKTVVVISHDADFLNIFTDGVLYLNKARCQVEQYRGDYYDVVEQIAAQIEKEQMQNARAEKKIIEAKEKINFFSNKGGKMRKLASKMRDEVEEAEENKVEVRKDDKTITPFTIPFENLVGPIVSIHKIGLMNSSHEVVTHKFQLIIKKNQRYILSGPNGIGKSFFLKKLVNANDTDAKIHDDVRIGYYSQDFNALDMNMVVRDALHEVAGDTTDQDIYRVAAKFLLTGNLLKNTIGLLSEGQKGLLCYAMFVLQKPHLLILDEPTNHINFRHLPVIAEALNAYQGAMIMVSHDKGFVDQLEYLETIDLGRLVK